MRASRSNPRGQGMLRQRNTVFGAAVLLVLLSACDDGSSATTSTFTTGNTTGATSSASSTGGGTSSSSGSGTGGAGGGCAGPSGCYDCTPHTDPEFLNHCTDATCAPFDNEARLPLYNHGNLPAIP